MIKKLTRISIIMGSLLWISFIDSQPVNKQTTATILAYWSQIIGNGTEHAKDKLPVKMVGRFVINDGADCSEFIIEPIAVDESVQPIIPTPRNFTEKDANFKIKLCQFEMGSNWKQAKLKKEGTTIMATFPGPYNVGRRHKDRLQIVGIGDTGCRDLDCAGQSNKNFTQVIKNLVKKTPNPDFGVHVGDYRYLKGVDFSDAWDEWYLEFFQPAQPLLNTTPMIFVRGNHEQCVGNKAQKPDQYGRRWYQFFEPTVATKIHSCDATTASINDPWYVDVAIKNTSDGQLGEQHRLVVIDNSSDETHYGKRTFKEKIIPEMAKNFEQAIGWSDEAASVWWVMHKPLWYKPKGKEKPKKNQIIKKNRETKLALFNNVLQKLNRLDKGICKTEPCNIKAILSGHLHMYQYVDFTNDDWPDQYVLGHGGVDMNKNKKKEKNKKNKKFKLTKDQAGGRDLPAYDVDINLIYEKSGFLVWTQTKAKSTTSTSWSAINCLDGETDCRRIK